MVLKYIIARLDQRLHQQRLSHKSFPMPTVSVCALRVIWRSCSPSTRNRESRFPGNPAALPHRGGVTTLIRVRDNEEESNNNSEGSRRGGGRFICSYVRGRGKRELREGRRSCFIVFSWWEEEENRTCYSYRDSG